MEIISNIALITINETLIVQVVSFLIFLFLLNRIMIAPLRATTEDRNQYLEKTRLDMVAAEKKFADLKNQIASQDAMVREEGAEIRRKMDQVQAEAASQILAEARQTIESEREKATREINSQIAAARKALQAEAENLAAMVMEKVLKRKVS